MPRPVRSALEGGAAPRAPPTSEHLTGATTYRLSCTGPGGEAEDSVQIVVTPPGTEIVFQAGDSSSADIYVSERRRLRTDQVDTMRVRALPGRATVGRSTSGGTVVCTP